MQESGFTDFNNTKLLSTLSDISNTLKNINKELTNLNLTLSVIFSEINNNLKEGGEENEE